MKNTWVKWLLSHSVELLFVCFFISVSLLNFKIGVWLTGWDTLHPEFDFPLHIFRSLFGVWREDQGLGTLAAHSHMSDLPRIIVLWLLSFLFPVTSVKFIFILICYVIGPLGVFFFIQSLLPEYHSKIEKKLFSVIGAFWYGLNLGTVQHFFVVFEMFAVQFAALGWLFWLAINAVKKNKWSWYLSFFILSFLASPMAYASLLWFAYIASLGLFLLSFSLLAKSKLTYLARSASIAILSISSNGYWLFPNFYFLASGGGNVSKNSHINNLFSPEAFWHNQAYGTIESVSLLKNFLFNWLEYQFDGSNKLLLEVWQSHINQPYVALVGYIMFAIGILGIISLFTNFKNNKHALALFPIWLLGVFMLINQNPPFTQVFHWIRTNISLFEEGLRFPFTKFSLVYMLAQSVFISCGVKMIYESVKTVTHKYAQILLTLTTLLITTSLILFASPMLTGNLVNPVMKKEIPEAYFNFFKWSKTQPPTARFVLLPFETISGWHYMNWGYEGPGFLWFGMKQPLITRDFDRWSIYNETFYNQASRAVHTGNSEAFFDLLRKFNISFLIIDNSIVAPGRDQSYLKLEEIKNMLASHGAEIAWQEGNLVVFKLPRATPSSFIQTPAAYSTVSADDIYTKSYLSSIGNIDYISSTDPQFQFPFRDLLREEVNGISYLETSVRVERKISVGDNTSVVLPTPQNSELLSFVAKVHLTDNNLFIEFTDAGKLIIGDTEISIPKPHDINFTLMKPIDDAIVQLENNQIQVSSQSSTTAVFHLPFNRNLNLYLVDTKYINEVDGVPIAAKEDTLYFNVSNQIWKDFFSHTKHKLVEGVNEIVFSAPLTKYDIDLTKVASYNCDLWQRGEISNQFNDNKLQTSADSNAAACTSIELSDIAINGEYVINIKGNNTAGRSVKLYVNNPMTQRAEIEQLLKEGNFDHNYSLLRTQDDENLPYTINWETRSFGKPSKNEIDSLFVYPIPLTLLSEISLVNESKTIHTNTVSINNLWKIGTYQYGFRIDSDGVGNIFTLSQGFHEGWIAFAGFKLLPHHLYNGWANAWVIPPGKSYVTVIYWPQLLSFAGYILLSLTTLLICHKTYKSRCKTSPSNVR